MYTFILQLNSILIAFASQMVEKTAKSVSKNCYKVLEDSTLDKEMKNELFIMANYAKNELPRFTAAGFFSISRNTICGLFSTTATYFIVALQLNDKFKTA